MDDPHTSHTDLARRGFLGLTGSTALGLFADTAAAADPSAVGGDALAADVAAGFDGIRLTELGRYESNIFDEGGAEIVAYHAPTRRLFVINADLGGVDVLDVSDPSTPEKVTDIDVAGELDGVDTANSVSTSTELVAVAIGAADPQQPGRVGLYDPDSLDLLDTVTVGALPDKVTFTPDGMRALVANEGEPSDDYDTDPRGSVSVVDVSGGAGSATVATAGFGEFVGREDELRDRGIRVFGPDASAAQDFEPEYVTVSEDSETAWVSLQENNAIAEIDVDAAEVTDLLPLGFKDYSLAGNELDASNEDGGVDVRTWPIHGILQPDAIAAYSPGDDGRTYVVTANEGDSRDYDGFSEEAEVADLDLDPEAFDFSAIEGVDSVEELQAPENLGPKGVTTTLGDADGDGRYEEIYAFGGRSFSIFTADGELVFDSESDFEEITAQRYGDEFNNDNTENTGDSRSDNKGPEPEGLTLGRVGDRHFAFVGLERMGGVVVYEITDPESPTFLDYVNERDLSFPIQERIAEGDAPASAAGDLGPEGLDFAAAEESPTGQPLVFVGHEISGTTTVYGVESTDDPVPFQVDFVAGDPIEVLGGSEDDFYGRQERLIQYVHGDAEGVTERDSWINSLAAETRGCLGGYDSIEVHGDVATVEFTVTEGCELTLSLVSYSLPDGEFSFDTAGDQEMADATTATFEAGEHTLDVDLPTGSSES